MAAVPLPQPLNATTCAPFQLGPAAELLTQSILSSADSALSQLCDRPQDIAVPTSPDTVSIALDDRLVHFSITVPTEADIQGSAVCRESFEAILSNCVLVGQVWGGSFTDYTSSEVVYEVTQASDAQTIIEELENLVIEASKLEEIIFPSESGYPDASGVMSALPVASGEVSGFPEPSIWIPEPTATQIASGFPPVATGSFSGYYTAIPSGIPSGIASGFPALPTPEAPVFPGPAEFNALGRVKRGNGLRPEVERAERPRARWI